ncbi:zinc finger and BTB domain-containing protein 21 [Eublepharis macularius]|uniref:Zinc finger and BTB domain-containing protein 21 n=1 Tax=Eublepharis macularius TaxID=481883 RepID=A0AA97J0E5_EUBMA|nr:zinc finger and BTB domain-containing protein 21 [Eublepharis macularius]
MEGLLHYINPAHAISLLSALNEKRLKGQLCDVVLIVGDQKFRAHKNVLAASSEYFQTLFTKENETQSVFQLDFCEPDTFDNVLNYIYSSSLFVEKSSLAAVQEVGYSLGISFLTNIVSKSPQAPLPACPIKKIMVQEEDESMSQKRSVIVCQSKNEAQGENVVQPHHELSHSFKLSSSVAIKTKHPQVTQSTEFLHSLPLNEKKWLKDNFVRYSKCHDTSGVLDDQSRTKRNAMLSQTPFSDKEVIADEPRGTSAEVPLKRPCPPVVSVRSSSESTFLLQEMGKGAGAGEDRNLLYYSKLGLVIPSRVPVSENQSIDRSGPLVKSLLRRSLSMDSQVPVYLPSADLNSSLVSSAISNAQGRTLNIISPKPSMKEPSEKASVDDKTQVIHPHRLRSFSASQSTDREITSPPLTEIRIKTEPSSPLSDPSEIIRVTVGDASSANKSHLCKIEDDCRDLSRLPAKRRFQADRRFPIKKIKVDERASPGSEDNFEENSNPVPLETDFPDSDISKDEYGELEETKPNKKFKCKHCLKIFRSTAGLHRHVNMYHNPEKPYACDICHKRFHTNFKVWTHCQTQHGIVKNPSPASSSHAVLDEKFQRKLIDIVREREIKKALIVKLRRGKQGFQGQAASQVQVIKRNLRSRTRGAYICTYCGKAYRFLSQFKQHIKMHPGEKTVGVNKVLKPKEDIHVESPVENKKVYQCRLCNAKLSSLIEQGNHERLCRNATVCPYCSLRFSSLELKHDHEIACEYKKLTCLECMRTFKSSFSIWRHQVEVHNQNTMAPTENFSLPVLEHNGEVSSTSKSHSQSELNKMNNFVTAKEDSVFSDSSEQINFDSEDSSCLPEDLSVSKQFKIQIKEEPADDIEEEVVSEAIREPKGTVANKDTGLWPCEKCGKIFTVHKQLERHQELLCSVKPFICHVCNKAFRTNFRLWSHFQSHMAQATEEPVYKEPEMSAPANSPSPPPLPPPPPLPKIQPLEPDSPTGLLETPSATEKLFVPQESDTLFYHAPPLSAITFKRQYMCKFCHRTFKTAFSLWSHEQTHN